MTTYESLPEFTSSKPCPRCSELLHWPDIHNEIEGPQVDYDTQTGRIRYVMLTRFCIACGYREEGLLIINQEPTWTEKKEGE